MSDYIGGGTRSFLYRKLQSRIQEMANLQDDIHCDIMYFNSSDKAVKKDFECVRLLYLKRLDISLAELRDIMRMSDTYVSADEFMVESIYKRVRPITEEYLQMFVAAKIITKDDVDCIIAGGYSTIEAYMDDLDANMVAIGSSSEDISESGMSIHYDGSDMPTQAQYGSDSPIPSIESDASVQIQYNERDYDFEQDSDVDMDETLPNEYEQLREQLGDDEESLERVSSNSSTASRDEVDISVTRDFVWADDVEDLDVPDGLALPTPTTTYHDGEIISDIGNSTSEPAPEPRESDDSSTQVEVSDSDKMEIDTPQSPKLDQVEVSDDDTEAYEMRMRDLQDALSDINNPGEPHSPPVLELSINTILGRDPNSTEMLDCDKIMDVWVKEYQMPYWQWEILFLLRLAAQKYYDDFVAAREAYVANPYRDV